MSSDDENIRNEKRKKERELKKLVKLEKLTSPENKNVNEMMNNK